MALTELQYDYRSRKVTWSHPKSMGCPEYTRERAREEGREKLVQWGTMYCSWNSRATLRNCGSCSRCRGSVGVLPLNRVALFAAQITRESLDTWGSSRIESHHYHRAMDRSLSQHYEISLQSFLFLLFFICFFSSNTVYIYIYIYIFFFLITRRDFETIT